MSATMRAGSAPSSSKTEQAADNGGRPPGVNNQTIPDEQLAGLNSAVCNRSTLGHTVHHRNCKSCAIRRPDAVWRHRLGRLKYKYFLEQPTSLNGAGRDISFLCDAMVTQQTTPLPPLTLRSGICSTQSLNISESLIPEKYHIVKNKGLRNLELYEDAFTVYLQDDEKKLRVFPSMRPSGRLEVVYLMKMLDDMLEKAGVDQRNEELTQLSQMEGLLKLVQAEQNIYNIVFHELIRQVSVGCAERGQLLAKLRQRYQSLLERIPHFLKALHTEAVAQRALDRQLTEEIYRIKTSIQKFSMELSKIREHDVIASKHTQHAHWQLAEALDQAHTNSDVVQGYHELYELQRSRLEGQLVQLIEEKDCWSQFTFCLALKVIHVKKLQLVGQLHAHQQSWSKTAEHFIVYLTSKDTEDLNMIMELADCWKEKLTAFMSQMKRTEYTQYEVFDTIHQGITKWLPSCCTQSKCPDPKIEKLLLENIHADLKQWSNMLAHQCEHYQGETLFCWQQTLGELELVQESWLDKSLQLFKRHSCTEGEFPGSHLRMLLSELLKQLETQVSEESEVHRQIRSLLGFIESWISKLNAVICQPDTMAASDWLKLERGLHNWQSLANEALQNISTTQKENQRDKTKLKIYTETEKVLDKVQDFITSLSNLIDGENHRLNKEVNSIHMAQTQWILDLLLLMVPDHSEDHIQEPETNIPWQTLDEDAKILAEKLDCFSRYIVSFYRLIPEGQIIKDQHQVENKNEMNEWRKLQRECINWKENCTVLLTGLKGGPVKLPVSQPATTCRSNVPVSQSGSTETLVSEEIPTETTDSGVTEVKYEAREELKDGELMLCQTPVMKLICYDGNITQRNLDESSFHFNGTNELVASPATDKAQEAFNDLTTIEILQQELHDSELRVQSAEQRALKAEEALQAALEKIQDLQRQLQWQPILEPNRSEMEGNTTTSPTSSNTPCC
ncbi:axonemal dynein light chain domain-containing protein 1 [Echeneis naucrates]|uniref:axonemal dynein light chain domain-containing protein 1 n=1 Tax=Echeneis naucrates TaxID=173247 RepID=UPI001114641E|nr:axonemal dynein light chain domain-containing protein 1 [Echeneis naucrates]